MTLGEALKAGQHVKIGNQVFIGVSMGFLIGNEPTSARVITTELLCSEDWEIVEKPEPKYSLFISESEFFSELFESGAVLDPSSLQPLWTSLLTYAVSTEDNNA